MLDNAAMPSWDETCHPNATPDLKKLTNTV